jgi:DNA-binding NtrC family response regulator
MAESCTCGQIRIGCLGASILLQDGGPDIVSDAPRQPASQGSPRAAAWDDLAGGPLDAPAHLTDDALLPARVGSTPPMPQLGGLSLDEYLRRVEADCIASALSASGGNKSRAARLLGIKRSTLGDRIVRCGLET